MVILIGVSTLAICVLFYILTPDRPLQAKEITLVALAVTAVAILVQVIISRIRKHDDRS